MNKPTNAYEFLARSSQIIAERGRQYDKPEGERSIFATVEAFNAITGRNLSESEGWLLMLLLKQVRQFQNPGKFHRDSAEDSVSYAALLAESLVRQENQTAECDEMINDLKNRTTPFRGLNPDA